MLKLRGVYCPLITPFDPSGELFESKITHNVRRLERTELAGYVVGSRVGEGPLLTDEERVRLFDLVAAVAGEARQRIASVDAPSPRQAAALAAAASERGYDAVCACAPGEYVNADAGLYFDVLADESPVPVIVVTTEHGPLTEAAFARAAAHPNVAGAIHAGSTEGARSILPVLPEGFSVLTGAESSWVDLWDEGVQGAVLPLANAVPFHWLSVAEALRTREPDAARELAERAAEAADLVWPRLGPAGVKWATDLRGGYGGRPRAPLMELTPEDKAAVASSLKGLAN